MPHVCAKGCAMTRTPEPVAGDRVGVESVVPEPARTPSPDPVSHLFLLHHLLWPVWSRGGNTSVKTKG